MRKDKDLKPASPSETCECVLVDIRESMTGCDGSRKEENTKVVGETVIHPDMRVGETIIHPAPGQQQSVQASGQQQGVQAGSSQEVSIEVKQHHLFRYPSEWDPRESGKTKGGYLEGKIQLPKVNLHKQI